MNKLLWLKIQESQRSNAGFIVELSSISPCLNISDISYNYHVKRRNTNTTFNSIGDDRISLQYPKDWELIFNGVVDTMDWAKIEVYEEPLQSYGMLASVSVLSPVKVTKINEIRTFEQHMNINTQHELNFHFEKTGQIVDVKKIREEQLVIEGYPAIFSVFSGNIQSADGQKSPVQLEFRDIYVDDERLSIVTAYLMPISATIRKDIETIYNSLELYPKSSDAK